MPFTAVERSHASDLQSVILDYLLIPEILCAGPGCPAEDVRKGVDELLADVEFCRTHQCRPARFAEHACTAADFFYQVNAFEEAEQTLGAAIQVCWPR